MKKAMIYDFISKTLGDFDIHGMQRHISPRDFRTALYAKPSQKKRRRLIRSGGDGSRGKFIGTKMGEKELVRAQADRLLRKNARRAENGLDPLSSYAQV